MDGASLIEALTEMKSMLNSPLKAFNPQSESDSSIAENDIPSQFTRTMGKGMLIQQILGILSFNHLNRKLTRAFIE